MQNSETGCQPYNDTSPYKVSEYSMMGAISYGRKSFTNLVTDGEGRHSSTLLDSAENVVRRHDAEGRRR